VRLPDSLSPLEQVGNLESDALLLGLRRVAISTELQ